MKEVILLVLVGFFLWPFLFAISYYANGGDESELQKSLQLMRSSDSKIRRTCGFVCWVFLGKQNRWMISIFSFALLFILKIGGAL